jgi:hypothetical protein
MFFLPKILEENIWEEIFLFPPFFYLCLIERRFYIMSTNLAFRPIIGTNARILEQEPVAGCMWFALDTKRIYYSDGESFLSMGGNTGIYYGNMDVGDVTDSD